MCREQHLVRYLEGQCHIITLQQNRVRLITLLFKVGFYNYFTEMITVLRWYVAHNIWVAALKAKVTACMTLQQIRVWSITLLFEIGFYNYFIEMVTILGWHVARKFWSLPWRSRSQHDLDAKSCPAHNFVIWNPILKLFHRNDHHIETPRRKKIWVATLKVKVTACKNVSDP